MTQENLNIILDKHLKWLNNEEGGERVSLININLTNADLTNADLTNADLRRVNLTDAKINKELK